MRAAGALAVFCAVLVAACASPYLNRGEGAPAGVAAVSRGYSGAALTRVSAEMDPAMLKLAERHVPARRQDYWGRTAGWETFDLATIPTLGLAMDPAMAQRVNHLRLGAPDPPPPARPFVLKAGKADRARALQCLTQAIYYEAATEPRSGQEAVAQTVINRLRHPGYPKSVCGVVFEGAMRATGCQFSFTCDGSLARAPAAGLWRQAQEVARRALNGYVARQVGTATHYHADYVAPYWAPTLYKITQVGAHIFYRWTGPSGLPAAFVGRYRGGEMDLTPAILQGIDERIQGDKLAPLDTAGRTITLGPDARTYTITEPPKPGAPPAAQPAGAIVASRRAPTKDEVARINEKLKALEDPDAPISTAPPEPPTAFTSDLPIGKPKT
jgi:spore germination cell wall hydrolase CwlJ-like protein